MIGWLRRELRLLIERKAIARQFNAIADEQWRKIVAQIGSQFPGPLTDRDRPNLSALRDEAISFRQVYVEERRKTPDISPEQAERQIACFERDLLKRFGADINAELQVGSGIPSYTWRFGPTCPDEYHEVREGEEFDWEKGFKDGYPGEFPTCDCYGEPLPFDDLGDEPEPEAEMDAEAGTTLNDR
ncbi:hypothetical protein [Notoacmeibacter ruber]|uniref:hypothetical protein n=1 Tax=Notoacmeibacter ruber TaxID=2670375 RepID=UPI0011C45251|nr:hypothetical protein [Notoacmeibacter ruber]